MFKTVIGTAMTLALFASDVSSAAIGHDVPTYRTGSCDVLQPDDSASVGNAIRRLVSRPDSAYVQLRASVNIPSANPDSVREYRVDAACDSAATSYQANRYANGEPNVFIPVALFKINGTSKYMGTGLIYYGEYKQFIVFDSTLAVVGKINTNCACPDLVDTLL